MSEKFSSLSPNSSYDLELSNYQQGDCDFNDQETISVKSEYEYCDENINDFCYEPRSRVNTFCNSDSGTAMSEPYPDPFLSEAIIKDEYDEPQDDKIRSIVPPIFENIIPDVDESDITSNFIPDDFGDLYSASRNDLGFDICFETMDTPFEATPSPFRLSTPYLQQKKVHNYKIVSNEDSNIINNNNNNNNNSSNNKNNNNNRGIDYRNVNRCVFFTDGYEIKSNIFGTKIIKSNAKKQPPIKIRRLDTTNENIKNNNANNSYSIKCKTEMKVKNISNEYQQTNQSDLPFPIAEIKKEPSVLSTGSLKCTGLLDRRKTKHHKILRDSTDLEVVVNEEPLFNEPIRSQTKTHLPLLASKERPSYTHTNITTPTIPTTNTKTTTTTTNTVPHYSPRKCTNNNVTFKSTLRNCSDDSASNHNYHYRHQSIKPAKLSRLNTALPSNLSQSHPVPNHTYSPLNQSSSSSSFSSHLSTSCSSSNSSACTGLQLHTYSHTQRSCQGQTNCDLGEITRIPPEPLRMGKRINKRGQRFSLWQFLMYLLDSINIRECNRTGIKWINRSNGVFHIVDSKQVATLWGNYKERRDKMTYDSLARSLRHYYKKNLMAKINNRRLVYQIAQECLNWSTETFIKR